MGPAIRLAAAALLAVALLLAAGPARAQQRDSVRADSVLPDSVRPDSAGADSVRNEPPPDPRADSIIALLKRLPGFTVTEYQGERAVYRTDEGVLRLQGSAAVAREGDRLTADTIVYRDRQELVEAYGNPEVSGEAQELTGNVLYYDLARRRATALGARTRVTQQATWFVTGDVTLEGTERVYASHGQFTTCDLEIPHYHFESDRIKVVRDKYLVARPARLYFGKVPVMVLPFVVHSLERGRRSGLVVPRFSLNDVVRTNSNYTREISDVGWYWAINDYLGAQVTGTWRSEAYTALQGDLDYRWRRQFLNGRLSFRRYWENDGSRQLSFNGNTSWKPDERTDLGFQGNYTTSSQFIRQSTADPREATQSLRSTLSLSRRFDWGQLAAGASRAQSISDGGVDLELPRFSLSPQPLTFFRAPTAEQARWYSNTSLQWGLNGSRQLTQNKADVARGVQDRDVVNLSGGIQSISIGNLNLSATGQFNRAMLHAAAARDSFPALAARDSADGNWSASIGYQQRLIGSTQLTPNITLSQNFARRDTTGGEYLGSAVRMTAGVSLSTALFGFFPGVGPYTTIRHRFSPTLSFGYSPEARQTDLQSQVFGQQGGRTQSEISLSFNQTFEAKLRPRDVQRQPEIADTLLADSAAGGATQRASQPQDPQKITILSINTSPPLRYDFAAAAEGENGFKTERISNSISSDYLQGLTIQMEHDLFDRSNLDPGDPGTRGELGSFAPRLSQLSTSFQLGPNTALVALLGRILGAREQPGRDNPATEGVFPGEAPESGDVEPTGAATQNPQGTGGGPWSVGMRYNFTRPQRRFVPRNEAGEPLYRIDDGASQTLGIDARFVLTPSWGVSWNTDYSITDREFGTHNLRFTRDLHRWRANFNFYKTPDGNSAFEFFVELIDNPELKVDYRESNLGIDRRR